MGLAVQNEQLTRRVGAIALGLLGAAFVLVFLMQDVHCRGAIEVEVFFEHAGALREGAPVIVAGEEIGEVRAIQMVPLSAADADGHLLRGTGGVAVKVRIEERYRDLTLKNGEVFVGQRSLISPAYLELGPPPAGQPPGAPLDDGDQLRGVSPPLIDRVLQKSYQNLLVSKVFLAQVRPHAAELRDAVERLAGTLEQMEIQPGDLGRLADSWRRLGDQVDAVTGKMEASGVEAADLRALARGAADTMEQTRRSLADLQVHIDALGADIERMRGQVPPDLAARFIEVRVKTTASLARLERIATTLRDLAAMVERGDGNIGGLTRDPEFADHAKEIGKILKRAPWRILGTDRDNGRPPP